MVQGQKMAKKFLTILKIFEIFDRKKNPNSPMYSS
jgi:hypothetical protein